MVEPFSDAKIVHLSCDALRTRSITVTQALLSRVHARERLAVLADGDARRFDALLVAVGGGPAHRCQARDHVHRPVDRSAAPTVDDVERGAVHRVAFVVPRGVTWALPPYELALQLAAHANESTITPDETVATETAGLDILGEAFDLAGNKGTDKATVKLDKTEPSIKGEVIAGKLGDDGWYTGPVTVHFTCSDALSGVDVCPEDEVINSNGLAQKATGKAIDAAGNSASTTVSVNIDQVARPRRS